MTTKITQYKTQTITLALILLFTFAVNYSSAQMESLRTSIEQLDTDMVVHELMNMQSQINGTVPESIPKAPAAALDSNLENVHIFVALGDGAAPYRDEVVNGVTKKYASEFAIARYLKEHKARKTGPMQYLLVREGKAFHVRFIRTEEEFINALGLPGAHIVFEGHSNYGAGPSFEVNPDKKIDFEKTQLSYKTLFYNGCYADSLFGEKLHRLNPAGTFIGTPDKINYAWEGTMEFVFGFLEGKSIDKIRKDIKKWLF